MWSLQQSSYFQCLPRSVPKVRVAWACDSALALRSPGFSKEHMQSITASFPQWQDQEFCLGGPRDHSLVLRRLQDASAYRHMVLTPYVYWRGWGRSGGHYGVGRAHVQWKPLLGPAAMPSATHSVPKEVSIRQSPDDKSFSPEQYNFIVLKK